MIPLNAILTQRLVTSFFPFLRPAHQREPSMTTSPPFSIDPAWVQETIGTFLNDRPPPYFTLLMPSVGTRLNILTVHGPLCTTVVFMNFLYRDIDPASLLRAVFPGTLLPPPPVIPVLSTPRCRISCFLSDFSFLFCAEVSSLLGLTSDANAASPFVGHLDRETVPLAKRPCQHTIAAQTNRMHALGFVPLNSVLFPPTMISLGHRFLAPSYPNQKLMAREVLLLLSLRRLLFLSIFSNIEADSTSTVFLAPDLFLWLTVELE